ncbi:MAG: peptidoglycan DD-metalloendopeptidase family protein [Clostridiales bacterium]|jgi:murein DD-endopeptidase MepM/ murein hydrolase activator NlpD|nr:peptidoglycan DD-metalloendopeptidase family protein [Clostridiales bacterium]
MKMIYRNSFLTVLAFGLLLIIPGSAWAFVGDTSAGHIPADTVTPLYLRQLTVFAERQQEARNAVVEHRVARGETLGRIAVRYNTAVHRIMADNGLVNPHFIREGQILYVVKEEPAVKEAPSQIADVSGAVHKLTRGETIWDLAIRYRVSMNDILVANSISDPHRLQLGQQIVIPGATVAASTVTTTIAEPKRDVVVASRTASRTTGFIWPTQGNISSGYGPRWGRFHYGIDIATKTGTPIVAVAAGTVVESGWRTGYGYMIHLNHHDGWESLYAHASKLYVKSGQAVQKGEKIAAVGQTGNSTGPHLHLELIFEGKHQNPLKHLP